MYIIVLGMFVCALCAGYVHFVARESARIASKRSRFADRARVPVAEIIQNHFDVSQIEIDKAIQLWCELADILKIDAQLMRPEDRFGLSGTLGPVAGYAAIDDEWEDAEIVLLRLCDKHHIEPEQLREASMRLIITLFCKHTSSL